MSRRLVRRAVEAMRPYVPGEQPGAEEAARLVKLNTNENPYPPPPEVVRAIEEEAGRLRLYPEPTAAPLRERASAAYGLPAEQVIAGNGSDELLALALRAFCETGGRAAAPEPTYSLYPVLAAIHGAEYVSVPFGEDYSLPKGLFGADAEVVFLSNPNSPTGTVVPTDEVARLADSLRGVLVVDEAYADFADGNALTLARERENVLVLRSFSKSFSLAGLRLGLGFGARPLVDAMMKVKDSYNVSRFAIAAGCAALENLGLVSQNVARVRATRERAAAALRRAGLFVYPSGANFLFVRVPGAERMLGRLRARSFLVRHFKAPRLADALRVTIGTDAQMDGFLAALAAELEGG